MEELVTSERNHHGNDSNDDDSCTAVDVSIRDGGESRAAEDTIDDAEAGDRA